MEKCQKMLTTKKDICEYLNQQTSVKRDRCRYNPLSYDEHPVSMFKHRLTVIGPGRIDIFRMNLLGNILVFMVCIRSGSTGFSFNDGNLHMLDLNTNQKKIYLSHDYILTQRHSYINSTRRFYSKYSS